MNAPCMADLAMALLFIGLFRKKNRLLVTERLGLRIQLIARVVIVSR